MEPQASLGVGWGLGEAFRRVLMKNNMDLWLSIIGLNSHRIPELNERIIDDIFNSSRIIEEQRIEFYKFWNSYCFSFRNYFQSGNLIAFGHAENLNAPFSFIDISKWQSLDRFDFRNSTVLSSDGAGRFVGVMAFPVVDAPNAPSLLAGLKMLDVVQRFVARDPELQLRHLEKILDGSNASTTPFDIMLSLAKPGEILAPIAGDTSRILDVLICAPGPLAPAWHPEPFVVGDRKNPEIQAAFYAARNGISPAAQRLASLFRLVKDGAVRLQAIAAGKDVSRPIPAMEFERPGISLCLATGDIWQEADGGALRIFHAVRLAKPIDVHGLLESGANLPLIPAQDTLASAMVGRRSLGGTDPQYNWKKAVPHALARLLLERPSKASAIASANDLYRAIGQSLEELGGFSVEVDTIKTHMEKHNRPLLDEIRERKNRIRDASS